MHTRFVGLAVRAATVAAALTGMVTWAPVANAAEPAPSVSPALAEAPALEMGSVEITMKSTAGDALPSAVFVLLDSDGQQAGRGDTDGQGKLVFPGLAPGVYRLKESASGNPLYEVAADQDVIVTPGAATRLTITNPFKAVTVHVQAKDGKTGKPLQGASVNIGTGTSTLLTLTTGASGTTSADLPMTSRRTEFWAKQIKAPAGHALYTQTKTFTARPGTPVTVTFTNAQNTTRPKPGPSEQPSHEPTGRPSAHAHHPSTTPGASAPTAGSSATAAETPASDDTPRDPQGSLAHTGADATPWIAASAGLLIAVGAITLFIARRRMTTGFEPDDGDVIS
ncbi:SpaA isopeptide-forming pilin-related protein [Streptomyces sp. NPDC047024]|uniref:SpaA isopeptide-forming pilin-related protein n=1 Tax=Streptomyces sp. NPDC047024 TaxID=3155476 RepID=UPI00340388EF